MKGVVDQRDMFAFCYAMLGDEQLEQVDDIAELRPRPPDAFYRLRDRLISTHSQDAYHRLEQLLALPPLGGQRPSSLLAQMRQLCPPGEEHTMFFRGLFLQRLPPQLRMQLAEDRHSPVQALAARADALVVHHSYSSVAAASSQPEPDGLVAAVPPGKSGWQKKRGKAPPTGGRGPKAAKKDKPWEELGICKFHFRYGSDCYSCADPASCKWPQEN
jgi:hypothetical protein